jgi:ATP-dependent DNA helicase RecG
MEALFQDIQYLKGIGPKRSRQFKRLGVDNIFDLFWYVPRAYFNRGHPDPIKSLKPGEAAAVRATVKGTHASRSRRGLHIFKALMEDDTGLITAVWFNQPFLDQLINPGQELFVSGKVKTAQGLMELNVSEYEILDAGSQQVDVLPVYALTEGLSQKTIRGVILYILNQYLHHYPDILSPELKQKYDLCDIGFAFYNLHFPQDGPAYLRARKRLALEELLLFQYSLIQEQKKQQSDSYVVHQPQSNLLERIQEQLPFVLTSAQTRVLAEIYEDMGASRQMNRLLQGDVGSGKTVVAALSMARAVASGYQAAIMAPTEILVEQHYQSLRKIFQDQGVEVARLTRSTSAGERRSILEALLSGEINILAGTHSIIQDEVEFKCLGLAVIDEQHRFGVKQRALLSYKGYAPDLLVMTATPIPRTLALTLYGDLSLSIIDQMPPGRKKVDTRFVPNRNADRVYRFIARKVREEAVQAYIVCPLVEESEKQDLLAAITLYEGLKEGMFSHLEVGLIHGRLKAWEKEQIMQRFKAGEIKVLVSTTVIEVGVDVPAASIMVVMHAERFGLSQLHQLRGRVGRGKKQSYCFLLGDPHTEDGCKRLMIMENTQDGFRLAQEDLLLRGAGLIFERIHDSLDQLGFPHSAIVQLKPLTKGSEVKKEALINNQGFDNKENH